MKIVQRLKEKNRWMLVCVALLAIAAVTISLILVYAPREGPPAKESETAETAVTTTPPRPTAAPAQSPAATPVITPPAQSAASGSDVILQHVPRATESDLNGGLNLAPEADDDE